MDPQKPPKKLSRYIRFLGGYDLLFTLGIIIAFAIMVILIQQIRFIFVPLQALGASVLPPVITAFAFYHFLDPLVRLLEKFKVSHTLAVFLVFFGMLAFFGWVLVIIIPIIYDQIFNFISIFPSLVSSVIENIQKVTLNSELKQYYDLALEWLNNNLRAVSEQLLSSLGNTFNGLATIVSTVSNVLITVFTFPVILFFLLLDGNKFKQMWLSAFPPQRRGEINQLMTDINTQVGAYIKGKLLAAIVIGGILYIGFSIINLRYATALAILAALASLIPYLGSLISLVPLLIVAAIDSPFLVLQTFILWAIVQFLDGNVLSPSIVGQNLKIHPLTIIIVLMVSGNLMGIIGMIVGIPLYAILRVLFKYIFTHFRKRYNHYYGEKYEPYDLSETTEEPANNGPSLLSKLFKTKRS